MTGAGGGRPLPAPASVPLAALSVRPRPAAPDARAHPLSRRLVAASTHDAHAPRAWGHEARARRACRLKEKDNLRERLADAEERGIPFLAFFGDQELAKARSNPILTLILNLAKARRPAAKGAPSADRRAHMTHMSADGYEARRSLGSRLVAGLRPKALRRGHARPRVRCVDRHCH